MSPQKDRGPKSLVTPSNEKRPKADSIENWKDMQPAWRVSLLEMHTPFGWTNVDEGSILKIRERLGSLESSKWKDFFPNYRNHFIKLTSLCKDARDHLERMQQDDIDSVVSLGVTQTGRIFGILEHNILKILWWDPDHQICPMDKPNT